MGGDYYDRDVPETTYTTSSYSDQAQSLGTETTVHSSLKPLRWTDENLMSDYLNPIIFALDVTGSMGEWAKIIYDKMPMFYGQIMMQKYLSDPAISFCAIGDHTCDDVPLQVTEFGQGKAIDQLLSKMVLLKSGNGNEHESYELAAYFYDNNLDLLNSELPFFFVTGDEGFFEQIQGTTVQTVFGKGIKQESIPSSQVWASLMQKFNVFHIHKPYTSANYEKKIHKQWVDLLGEERVLDIVTPKACVDVMLGAIALTSGRSLENYIEDMKTRGQSDDRIEEVDKALVKYSLKLKNGNIVPVRNKSNPLDQQLNNINLGNDKNENNENVIVGNNNVEVNQDDLEETAELAEKLMTEDMDEDDINLREKMKSLRRIPKEFICPIMKEICFDPVMTCDGITYERKAIEIWLDTRGISPVTGLALDSKILLPNFALKQLVRDYIQSSK
jgi:hypothetical protein